MRSRLTLALLATLVVAVAPVTTAQSLTACANGTANGFSCSDVDLGARIPTGVNGPLRTGSTNDIWGWTDPQDGREYALVGTRSGTVFVDVTDPSAVSVLGKLPTQTGNSTWRDMKTYENYVFVVSEASDHGMQVFDLTRLRGLTEDPSRDFTNDAFYNGVGSNRPGDAHNIVINEDSGFAYMVGSDDCNGGLHMVDIQDPLNPSFAGCFSNSYVHDAHCITYAGPDTDYAGREICVNSTGNDTQIVDVTDKSAPSLISSLSYPSTGYAHQGWFTEDRNYYIANDEADEFNFTFPGTRTLVFDVQDLDSPSVFFEYYGPEFTADHNLYVKGDYAYLSNYESGLRILDLSGIENGVLSEVAYFDTYSDGNSVSYSGQWSNYPYFASGTVIATDQDFGLFVLRPNLMPTSTTQEAPGVAGFALSAPAPNPSRGTTTLTLVVGESQSIVAEVFDVAGRRVATLQDGVAQAGSPLALTLDGTDLPAGLYLVRVQGETFSATERVSLLR